MSKFYNSLKLIVLLKLMFVILYFFNIIVNIFLILVCDSIDYGTFLSC